MYAIIRHGSRQHRVREGQTLLVDRLGKLDGEHVFEDVLFVSDEDDDLRVGAPLVGGASVKATVLGETRTKKVIVFKKKKRKGYKRKNGHRQTYTRIRVDGIGLGG